jgi:hypothetical protein
MRKVTSLTIFLSFLALLATSVVLYIVPHGRVAYWADWRLLGMTKTEWGNLHVNLGVLFILAGFFHLFYNWSPITAYMKNRARELKIFTPAFSLALTLTVLVAAGTYLEIPPMSSVTNLGESIKNAASVKYGEPPYGHAELSSLKLFAKKQNLDLDRVEALLHKSGLRYTDSSQTLAEIAANNTMSPQELFFVIKPASTAGTVEGKIFFPDSPMPGFGNKTLVDVCQEFNLVLADIQYGLAEHGIESEADKTIKEIAAVHGKNPLLIFEIIHETVFANQDR